MLKKVVFKFKMFLYRVINNKKQSSLYKSEPLRIDFRLSAMDSRLHQLTVDRNISRNKPSRFISTFLLQRIYRTFR